MKLKFLFLYLLTICMCTSAAAQEGLNIDRLFQGRVVPKKSMVVVKVKGQAIRKYNLTFYHSLRFQADESQLQEVKAMLEADQQQAVSSKTSTRQGLQTTILQLSPRQRLNRFLCVVTQDTQPAEITVVYMEGHAESITQLEKLIRNN